MSLFAKIASELKGEISNEAKVIVRHIEAELQELRDLLEGKKTAAEKKPDPTLAATGSTESAKSDAKAAATGTGKKAATPAKAADTAASDAVAARNAEAAKATV